MTRQTLLGTLFLIAAATACNKNQPAAPAPVTPPPSPVVVHVSQLSTTASSSILLLLDSTFQVATSVSPANSTNPKLSYTSSIPSILKADSTGLLTGVGLGMATVTVTSLDNPQLTVTIHVAVVKNYIVYAAGYGPDTVASSALLWINNSFAVLQPGPGRSENYATATGLAMSGNDLYVGGQFVNNEGWNAAIYWKNGIEGDLSDPANDFNNNITAIGVSGTATYLAGYDLRTISFPSWDPTYLNLPIWNGSYYSINGNAVTRTPLETDSNYLQSLAYAMTLSGSDVYLAGALAVGNGTRIATYWKNDENGAVALASGGDWSEAEGIALQGGDVYITGYDECPNYGCIPTVKLWKNNEQTVVNLTNGTVNAFSSCLAVNDTAEFVGGYQQTAGGVKQAIVWRISGNTLTRIPLSDGTSDAVVNAIVISGNDIFLAGYQVDPTSNYRKATCWRVYGSIVSAPVKLPSGSYIGAPGNSEVNAILIK
jgi:hypothetical protein